MWRIEFTPRAVRDLGALPANDQRRIARAIDRLAEHPHPRGARKLQGADPLWRLRVGDHRVIYLVEHDRIVVTVVRVGHRRDVYR